MTEPSNVILSQIEAGPMQNFVYFIGDQATKEVAIVDPAWDINVLMDEIKENGYTLTYILLTHGHADHANGVDEILETYDVPVIISAEEVSFFRSRCKNVKKVRDGEKISIGKVEVECLLTPGHTPGSQCFKCGNYLITGDTLFIDGCGRCDLQGGDAMTMYNSLYQIIMKLPDDTIIYPGHDYGSTPFATLESQKKTNPYLLTRNLDEFLKQRMGIWI